MSLKPIDLVMHDWINMPPEERKQALEDIRTLATTIAARHENEQRRARALNVVASFFHFLTEVE